MDFADLQTFRAVVEHGGVTAAATQLHRVQSSISARLSALERDLGCALFERAGRRLQLTPEGRHLYERSAALVQDLVALRQELAGTGPGAVLCLGAMESTAAVRLAPVLAQLRRGQPGMRLSLRTGTTGALLQGLEQHALDAVLVAGPANRPALHWQPVFEEELVLIAPLPPSVDSTLASPLPPGLVTFSAGCAYREVALDWARAQGLPPGPATEIGSYHALAAAVTAGMGLGLLPRAVLSGIDTRGLQVQSLPEAWARQITWLVTRQEPVSAALRALVQALQEGGMASAG
ncbi:LysR family transcriptional regulator [Curvibacter sp. HBC28]|uniref:LysR family transcriptional regulator n=1 Tax=Curvibacter microcysteis TaxID=3026419 RepID=A0ABT5MB59_9BURK|nr:LysR family transcriptional regulator [Curvibacter sp. HBC28]MDD0813807.1 LysR family transcriptional regulator [Curvibacter sp. HBC28]